MKTFAIDDAVSWKDDTGKSCFGMIVGFDETSYDGETVQCAVIDQGVSDEQLEIPLDDLELLG